MGLLDLLITLKLILILLDLEWQQLETFKFKIHIIFFLLSCTFFFNMHSVIDAIQQLCSDNTPTAMMNIATLATLWNKHDSEALLHEMIKLNLDVSLVKTAYDWCDAEEIIDNGVSLVDSVCTSCNHTMIYNHRDCMQVCSNCAISQYAPQQLYELQNNEWYDEIGHTSKVRVNIYKRSTNLHIILKNIQSPKVNFGYGVIERIKVLMTDADLISLLSLRRRLAQHYLSAHFKNIHSLFSILNPDYVPLTLKNDEADCIHSTIMCRIKGFEMLVKNNETSGRKNFISYHLAIHFAVLELGYTHVLPHLILPKSATTLQRQIDIWNKSTDAAVSLHLCMIQK